MDFIVSANSYLGEYQGTNKDKLHEFCVKQAKGNLTIYHAYLHENCVIIAKV